MLLLRSSMLDGFETNHIYSSTSRASTVRYATTSSAVNAEITELMLEYDPILLFASRLLPSSVAADASALYAWCRRLDEICDKPGADPKETREKIDDWQIRLDKLWIGEPVDAMDAELVECLQRHQPNLDEGPFRDMITGMRSDAVENRRVADMDELEEYAYQVAGTVGLMLLPLLDANFVLAKEPAICLGKAVQLINILRDASPDAALGRIYLPQDQLRAQNVKEIDVLALKSSPEYCAVVEFVSNRASELLVQAEKGRTSLPGLGPLFVQIIVELYRGYLEELQRRGYNNLAATGERVKINKIRKFTASLTALQKVLLS